MEATTRKSFVAIVLKSLGWPLLWGSLGTGVLYWAIHAGILRSAWIERYLAGHWVEYAETGLFVIGIAALGLKLLDLGRQLRAIHAMQLPEMELGGDTPESAPGLLQHLEQIPRRLRGTYMFDRISSALHHLRRTGSADGLGDHLKYQSELAQERAHESYALVRIIVWATPMLGFLGTVIGITMALGDLSPEALVNSPQEAMQGLLSGLGVAFDTTALALTLSMVLMFVQYLMREIESQLLSGVDLHAEDLLIGRFQLLGTTTDPTVQTVKQMTSRMLASMEQLVERQAELWHSSMGASQKQWIESLHATQNTIEVGFRAALMNGMTVHAEAMSQVEREATQRTLQQWQSMQQLVQRQTEAIGVQQQELARQGDILLRVLQATGDVTKLEDALNHNLSALAGAKNFEDTVVSLSAAIQLLSARLNLNKPSALQLQEANGTTKGRAA